MTPLTKLCGKGVKFQWTDTEEQAFKAIKSHIAEEVLLSFPVYGQTFEIFTDCSDFAMSAGIRQGDKWLAFFSKKLSPAQQNYPITDRELLAIVETLKNFKHMLLGQPITVFTDHENLTYVDTVHASDRVLRQRLLLEEYGADIKFIPGKKNNLADALSRLPFESTSPSTCDEFHMIRHASEMEEDFPLSLHLIATHQQDDEHLVSDLLKPKPRYFLDKSATFNIYITKDHKVYVPATLRAQLLAWYHEMLHHPGETRLSATIKQHFYWPGIDATITNHVKTCDTCQTSKITAPKKYGKIPLPTDTITDPWDHVHVDMIGPWTVSFTQASRTTTEQVKALTIIDKGTGWVEFVPTVTFLSKHVAELFDSAWLCRYPRPSTITFDNGGEFVGSEFQELISSYGINPSPTTVKNPQGNAICERVHLTMGDMLRTITFTGDDWFHEHNQTLQSVAWAVRSTVTANGYSPGQLVFSRDMILSTKVKIDWERIKTLKQAAAVKNNSKENTSRIDHKYQVGDKVLIVLDATERRSQSKLNSPTRGPYVITKV
jgi:transposase InsO family protein